MRLRDRGTCYRLPHLDCNISGEAMIYFAALKVRAFALLWTGQLISRVGDFLYQVILAWWVLEKTGSATVMGVLLICSFTPMLLFLLIGGVAADRYPRVQVMVASDLLRGAIVSIVAILALTQRLEVWHVCCASIVFGLVNAFFQPSYSALVPEIVARDVLPSANALTSLSMQIGRVVGPGLGALLIGLGSTGLGFMLNGLSFFLSAACLVPLLGKSAPIVPQPMPQRLGVLRDAREGVDTVLRSPILWISMIVMALSNITLGGPYNVALPFLVKDHLKADATTLGLLYASFPIGYVLGGILLGQCNKYRRRGLIVHAGLAIAGLMIMSFGLPMSLIALVFAALLNGAALEMTNLVWTNILQEVVPGERLGRISSIDSLGSYALLPVGYALAGWTTDWLGAAPVFILGGGLTAVFALLALVHPAIHTLD
jgi:MFS family permease